MPKEITFVYVSDEENEVVAIDEARRAIGRPEFEPISVEDYPLVVVEVPAWQTRYEIEEGRSADSIPVYRVVEYVGFVCKGGRGSFLQREYAESWIAAKMREKASDAGTQAQSQDV